ncbi:hypothetical protein ETC03_16695 [Geobacillus sp. MMMUD3]|nr:hypothetical protein [Geobacillus sp. MMMUD3]
MVKKRLFRLSNGGTCERQSQDVDDAVRHAGFAMGERVKGDPHAIDLFDLRNEAGKPPVSFKSPAFKALPISIIPLVRKAIIANSSFPRRNHERNTLLSQLSVGK